MITVSARNWLSPALEIVSRRATSAVKSYALDQLKLGQRLAITWAIAGGLFLIAVLFVIGIVIVGLIALFSFLRLHFGLFQSYGIVAAILFLLVLLFSVVAMGLIRRPTPHLTSRLRLTSHAPPPSGAAADARAPGLVLPNRSGLLFAAAAIVLTVAAIGGR